MRDRCRPSLSQRTSRSVPSWRFQTKMPPQGSTADIRLIPRPSMGSHDRDMSLRVGIRRGGVSLELVRLSGIAKRWGNGSARGAAEAAARRQSTALPARGSCDDTPRTRHRAADPMQPPPATAKVSRSEACVPPRPHASNVAPSPTPAIRHRAANGREAWGRREESKTAETMPSGKSR